MGVMSRLKHERRALTESEWLLKALGVHDSYTGRSVGVDQALTSTAVFGCVRIIAESVGSLPLPVYRRLQPQGKERDPRHPLYRLLHDAPNPEMIALAFREALTGHTLLRGNGYAEIQRDEAERVIALWPLRPDRMRVTRDEAGELAYVYDLPEGKPVRLPTFNVLHLPGFGGDGLTGYSVISYFREAVALALAVEEYGGRFFGNNARPGGVLQVQKTLSPEAAKRLKTSWETLQGGLANAHRVAVLEEGVTWQQVGIPPEDAQFLETRRFQTTEIARIFRVPPHMIGDLERATFSNIEHQSLEFVMHTLRPWLVRWEQALGRDVFARQPGGSTRFAEHLVDGLLRGDAKARADALAVQRQNGVITANEWREIENRNPHPDGDALLVNGNMIPATQAGRAGQPATTGENDAHDATA